MRFAIASAVLPASRQRSRRGTGWAALAAAMTAFSIPLVVGTWGWLTWSDVNELGEPDDAPRRACAVLLMLSPLLIGFAALYFFVLGALLRRFRLPTFHGMAAAALCVSAVWGILAAVQDPFDQGLRSFAILAGTALVPLVLASMVYSRLTRAVRP
ncbi:MAG TPA: hypothetical protein VEK07_13635 [Polyangiaceae bacterium]|nr:hypothetical protein [Polyangiaceae bacterium]